MTTAIWISLLVVFSISSFAAGSLFTKRQYEHDELEKEVEKAQDTLEQYKQDVADHLAGTNKLVAKMKENYEQLVKHVDETNQLFVEDRRAEVVPFFSAEATEHLAETANHDKTKQQIVERNAELDAAPADFVSGETGIFKSGSLENEQTKQA